MIANLGVFFGSVQRLIHDILGMRRVEARLVPKVLNFLQKQHRIAISKEILSLAKMLSKASLPVTRHGIYEYDIETQESSEWHSHSDKPKPKKLRQSIQIESFVDRFL